MLAELAGPDPARRRAVPRGAPLAPRPPMSHSRRPKAESEIADPPEWFGTIPTVPIAGVFGRLTGHRQSAAPAVRSLSTCPRLTTTTRSRPGRARSSNCLRARCLTRALCRTSSAKYWAARAPPATAPPVRDAGSRRSACARCGPIPGRCRPGSVSPTTTIPAPQPASAARCIRSGMNTATAIGRIGAG